MGKILKNQMNKSFYNWIELRRASAELRREKNSPGSIDPQTTTHRKNLIVQLKRFFLFFL